jgi:hypothetical protein
LVVPAAGIVKGVPERIVKAPLGTVATPLLRVVPPRFVRVKDRRSVV